MSLLNTVMGALGGGSGGGSPLMSIVMGMLNNKDQAGGGGLGGLMQQFQNGGLGDAAQSWIGSGSNLPISADQLSQVFGSDKITEMAAQAGISTDDLSGQLAELLPNAVDKLTPDGEVPSGDLDMGAITSVLGSLFGK